MGDYSLAAAPARNQANESSPATSAIEEVKSKPAEAAARVAARPAVVDVSQERLSVAIEFGAREIESSPSWLTLSGCETKLGGVLFLINLIQAWSRKRYGYV